MVATQYLPPFRKVIAGPCSAESESQIFETALQLSKIGVKYYRAGLWKPRTFPNSFEGVGKIGLSWLKKVQKELKLKVGTEVANKEHVIDVLRAKLDFIWIGARTATNPFAVQEIAEALHNVDMLVLVKNPIVTDIDLWCGAIERLSNAGVKNIIAVHRGFSSENSTFRNAPQWYIPIEFKRRKPEIPLLCDPSHIAGDGILVEQVVMQAHQLNFDGLMIEVHHNPKIALSDAKQQITPYKLKQILNKIKTGINTDNNKILSVFRAKIDELDKMLLDILSQRMEISRKIGIYKKENNISVLQSSRYEEVVKNCLLYAKEKELSADFIKQLLEIIHQESINVQF